MLPLIEISPNSRFSIHENPNMAPGTCCVCKSPGGDGRNFIDFGMQLDVFGSVYFCSYCFVEAAETVGFVPSEKLARAQIELAGLHKEHSRLEESFRDFRESTRTILRDCRCDRDSVDADSDCIDVAQSDGSIVNSDEDDSDTDKPRSVKGH